MIKVTLGGQTLGPHHLDPYVEIVVDWDWGDYLGLPCGGLVVFFKNTLYLLRRGENSWWSYGWLLKALKFFGAKTFS